MSFGCLGRGQSPARRPVWPEPLSPSVVTLARPQSEAGGHGGPLLSRLPCWEPHLLTPTCEGGEPSPLVALSGLGVLSRARPPDSRAHTGPPVHMRVRAPACRPHLKGLHRAGQRGGLGGPQGEE